MTRDEIIKDNERTLAICEQVSVGEAMVALDWLHEGDMDDPGRLEVRLAALDRGVGSLRAAADALEAHAGLVRGSR